MILITHRRITKSLCLLVVVTGLTPKLSQVIADNITRETWQNRHTSECKVSNELTLHKAMLSISFYSTLNPQEVIEDVLIKGQVDKTAQQQLRSILLQEEIGEVEKTLIDRILYGVRRGILQLATDA